MPMINSDTFFPLGCQESPTKCESTSLNPSDSQADEPERLLPLCSLNTRTDDCANSDG